MVMVRNRVMVTLKFIDGVRLVLWFLVQLEVGLSLGVWVGFKFGGMGRVMVRVSVMVIGMIMFTVRDMVEVRNLLMKLVSVMARVRVTRSFWVRNRVTFMVRDQVNVWVNIRVMVRHMVAVRSMVKLRVRVWATCIFELRVGVSVVIMSEVYNCGDITLILRLFPTLHHNPDTKSIIPPVVTLMASSLITYTGVLYNKIYR